MGSATGFTWANPIVSGPRDGPKSAESGSEFKGWKAVGGKRGMSHPITTDDSREIVRVDAIVKDFRPGLGLRAKRVLHEVSFAVREGEIYGFVGPNGAGKTTTLKILMGLIRPTSGNATILDCDVTETGFREHIGFLPENPYFYSFLTAEEILRFYARLSGVGGRDRDRRVQALIELVGLGDARRERLSTYSKGMLQRVGIAQALIHDPKVVFLDEPMSGLDPIGRKDIRDIILRLKSEGKTVFMNTHILNDVEMICDRVAIIVKGRIRHEGPIREFMNEEAMRSDIVLAHLAPEVAEQLGAKFSARVQTVGEQVEVQVMDGQVRDLLKSALEAGAEVLSLSPNRISLERIFLEAVEQGEQADGSSAAERGAPAC
ncbi:MAG TPA: ABC transporter ATP-binding protein [Myxococcales bacterium]|nr:ABC transporter ATP-binding protein [Myxococcales bacterium]HIL02759.1 ABC transporter ATP-binding protein [Myxococcales bacterium]